jgi:hypothetical protein
VLVYKPSVVRQIGLVLPSDILITEGNLFKIMAPFADEYFMRDGEWSRSKKGLDVTTANVNKILTEMGYKL